MKIKEKMRIFLVLQKKNFLIRKKKWAQSLGQQLIYTIILIFLGLLTTAFIAQSNIRKPINDIKSEKTLISKFNNDWHKIRFTPKNNFTNNIMISVRNCLELDSENVIGAENEDAMLEKISFDQYKNSSITPIGIVFEIIVDEKIPPNFEYKIRFSSELIEIVQICLDKAYINNIITTNKTFHNTTWSVQQIPKLDDKKVIMSDIPIWGSSALALYFAFILLNVAGVESTFPSNEKHNGINVLMTLNGATHQMNLFGWLISGAIWSFSYLIPTVLAFKMFSIFQVLPFLDYGNMCVVLLALILVAMHFFCFTYHIASYFFQPTHATNAISLVFLIMLAGQYYAKVSGIGNYLVYLGSLCPSSLLESLFREISAYEIKLEGIGWFNLFTAGSSEGPSLAILMILSILGIVFHFYMAIFINKIRPGKFGVAHNPFSFLQKMNNQAQEDKNELLLNESANEGEEFETISEETVEPGIQIINLKKAHTSWLKQTKVDALRGVSVQFYKGQITALLGHNGAGKSTMINIISGLTSASDGDVLINGKNIKFDTKATKNDIGLCPQENIVFPDLTVYEHLMFFGELKGRQKSMKQIKKEVEILLLKLNMTEKKKSLINELSGGQKRKLCLAIAIISDADVSIFDEPTSGMDTETKREVWDLFLKMRGHKTIIISTHDMEEADVLGDRIVILDSGKLKSYGTPMFLKKLYGNGQIEVTLSVESWCNPSKVLEAIEMINDVNVLNKNDDRIILAVPTTDSLPQALDTLENLKKELGITGMSVSIITLEEVFLRITTKGKIQEDDKTLDSSSETKSFTKTTGFEYFKQTFLGHLIKNITSARKYTGPFWTGIILVFLLIANISIRLYIQGGLIPSPILDTTLKPFHNSKSFVRSSNLSLLEINYNKTIADFGGETKILNRGDNITEILLTLAKNNYAGYKKVIVSAEFDEIDGIIKANGLYSASITNGMSITINCISNALLKTFTGDSNQKILMSTQQLPKSRDTQESNIIEITNQLIATFMGLAAIYYVFKPFHEASSGIKQLQDMTGASKISYWVTLFIIDFIQFSCCMLILVVSFAVLDILRKSEVYHVAEIAIFLGLLLGFVIAVLPLIYIMSFVTMAKNKVLIVLTILTVILGYLATTTISIISLPNILLLIPHFNLVRGLHSFFNVANANARCRRMSDTLLNLICTGANTTDNQESCCSMKCSKGSCENPSSYFPDSEFPTPVVKTMLFYIASFILFFYIISILENGIISKIMNKYKKKYPSTMANEIDNLVLQEKILVKQEAEKRLTNSVEDHNENLFLVHELAKSYAHTQVVNGISFRVKQGECFGLLGVNGAGKSTTFKMLTGFEIPDQGTTFLKNFGIHDNRKKYLVEIGYCPQQNVMINALNAWDHLYLFARLRGIPESQIDDAVKYWIKKLNLNACADQPSETYSGGNKRRLNIALALIGNPSLVLMDEPTAGVDPAARRELWNTLKSCQKFGQSIILTSHSMDECELLSNRLAIMVKGQLVCIGAVQELKQRFGAGYNIQVKITPNRNDNDFEKIKSRIQSSLNCKKIDETSSFLNYHVTDSHATWTFMIETMRELKNDYECIEDFVVLSSKLEQLFIQFARGPEYMDSE